MAEALEDGGHTVETFAAGVHSREERVELVDDALLLVERRQREIEFLKQSSLNTGDRGTLFRAFMKNLVRIRPNGIRQVAIMEIELWQHCFNILVDRRFN